MSSFNALAPLTIPSRFRRKSSSASTSYSIDNHIYALGELAPSSSPLLSSSPLVTPSHLARPHEYTEWRTGDYPDDLGEDIYDQRDKVDDIRHPWSRHTRSMHSYTHRALPSLMTKFAMSTLWGDAPLAYSPPLFSSAPQTASFYPQGDSTISDECEEHDLESMNIHIRETYFATSAERGRWLSSPIAPRIRSYAAPPARGYSSPIKSSADMSPLGEHSRMRTKSCAIDEQTSLSEDRDEDMHCLSSLPPSSPLSSPLSHFSFLGDDCEENTIDPRPNSDDCNSFRATPELSTTCTSPTESERASTLYKVHLPLTHSHLSDSVISCHSSPRYDNSSKPIDTYVHAPDSPFFESDASLSPLSQFELDLPEPEPLKLPLSDMENKFYPGQHIIHPSAGVNAVQSHDGSVSVQFPSMKSNDEPSDIALAVGMISKKNLKKRENTSADPGARRTKKRAPIRPRSPFSDERKGKGAENQMEPPRKKSKLSHCRDGSGVKSRSSCGGVRKAERRRQSPSSPVVERCDSGSKRPTPESAASVDAEFHISLTGILVEALATSRATSMDSSTLYLALTQAHPCLVAERSKQELLMDIVGVLEAGRTRCGMFEKVDCSGERTRCKALESRWFYVPERDEDSERALLISAIMPRQKRNETKKYKQYYYRPLDKMSRWDPEDAP